MDIVDTLLEFLPGVDALSQSKLNKYQEKRVQRISNISDYSAIDTTNTKESALPEIDANDLNLVTTIIYGEFIQKNYTV